MSYQFVVHLSHLCCSRVRIISRNTYLPTCPTQVLARQGSSSSSIRSGSVPAASMESTKPLL
ncbi:uncharacterized protein FTOL_10278 [Fusarium torulosum]|uniref:Uncharacterized protein n=1 Tax=Fusarium torulosum TaxID=33205 RepID=A0AAE8MIB2_9HYPO|nr:uncharacterized protein FTOL_10278 [Fusarium torulosum]